MELKRIPLKKILVIIFLGLLFDTMLAQNTSNTKKEVLTFKIKKNQVSTTEVYTTVDQMPVFPGNGMERFIMQNIQYPAEAKENGISGTVYISFMVDTFGQITSPTILRGINGGKALEAEALRVVYSMPNWIPGSQNGNKVTVQLNIPIRFSLK